MTDLRHNLSTQFVKQSVLNHQFASVPTFLSSENYLLLDTVQKGIYVPLSIALTLRMSQ